MKNKLRNLLTGAALAVGLSTGANAQNKQESTAQVIDGVTAQVSVDTNALLNITPVVGKREISVSVGHGIFGSGFSTGGQVMLTRDIGVGGEYEKYGSEANYKTLYMSGRISDGATLTGFASKGKELGLHGNKFGGKLEGSNGFGIGYSNEKTESKNLGTTQQDITTQEIIDVGGIPSERSTTNTYDVTNYREGARSQNLYASYRTRFGNSSIEGVLGVGKTKYNESGETFTSPKVGFNLIHALPNGIHGTLSYGTENKNSYTQVGLDIPTNSIRQGSGLYISVANTTTLGTKAQVTWSLNHSKGNIGRNSVADALMRARNDLYTASHPLLTGRNQFTYESVLRSVSQSVRAVEVTPPPTPEPITLPSPPAVSDNSGQYEFAFAPLNISSNNLSIVGTNVIAIENGWNAGTGNTVTLRIENGTIYGITAQPIAENTSVSVMLRDNSPEANGQLYSIDLPINMSE